MLFFSLEKQINESILFPSKILSSNLKFLDKEHLDNWRFSIVGSFIASQTLQLILERKENYEERTRFALTLVDNIHSSSEWPLEVNEKW